MRNSRSSIVNASCQRLRHAWAIALTLLLVASPRISEACAVCSNGTEDENRLAFILTTAFLTMLPFALVAGVIWWLKSRFAEQERLHEQARRAQRAVLASPVTSGWPAGS